MDPKPIVLVAATCALALAAPARAHATERQIHVAPMLGYHFASGASGGHSGLVAVEAGYGLTDNWRLWSTLEYGLGGGVQGVEPRHQGSLVLGVAYGIDLMRALPWFGVGFRGAIVGSPAWTGFVPAIEARLGVDVPTSRYFGITFQSAYALPLANRDQVSHLVSAGVGLRLALDL